MGKTSAAQLRATKRYLERYKDLKIRVTQEENVLIESAAEAAGLGKMEYMRNAVILQAERETGRKD